MKRKNRSRAERLRRLRRRFRRFNNELPPREPKKPLPSIIGVVKGKCFPNDDGETSIDIMKQMMSYYHIVPYADNHFLYCCDVSSHYTPQAWYDSIVKFFENHHTFDVVCVKNALTIEKNFEVALMRAIKNGICRFE